MTTVKKTIFLHVIISVAVFAFIFYSQTGVSGGDMAIVIFSLMAGLTHVITVSVYFTLKKVNVLSIVIPVIIVSQVAELVIFAKWGYPINTFIKNIK